MKRIVTLLLALSLLLVSVTPALAQLNPGSAVVNFTVQNLDAANDANVQATYINQSGGVAARVPASGSLQIDPESSLGFPANQSGLPSGFEGSAIVSGDRELAGFAQVLFSGGTSADGKVLTAYEAFSAGANKLYFPSLAARANRQFSTLTIMSAENPSTSESINFSIKFYDRSGNLNKTVNDSVRKGSQKTFNLLSQGLPTTTPPGDGWLGAAVVESASPIAGVALTHWDQYSAGYSGVTGGGTKAFLPSGTRRLPGGNWEQFTSVQVQNLDAADAANVTVRWFDRTGALLHSFNDSIPANSSKGYNTRFTNSNVPDHTALFNDLGSDWNGSVVVESTNGKEIVAIANLQWTAASGPGESASAYASEPAGTATIYVPGAFRRVSGSTWEQYTGLIVQNVGGAACNNFDVIWKDRDGNTKLSYKDSLAQNISHGYNTRVDSDLTALGQNPANLGNQFRGSVTFKAPGCSLVAIHNTLFPEWTDSSTYNAFGK
jgi:hypothetical protein